MFLFDQQMFAMLMRGNHAALGGGGGGVNAIGASVHLNANQLIPASTFTPISWTGGTAVDFDTSGFFSGAAPTIFTAPFAGLYLASCSINWDSSIAGGTREVTFAKNGGIRNGISAFQANVSAVDEADSLTCLFNLSVGDTLAVQVLQGSAGNLNALGGAANNQTFFSVLGFH